MEPRELLPRNPLRFLLVARRASHAPCAADIRRQLVKLTVSMWLVNFAFYAIGVGGDSIITGSFDLGEAMFPIVLAILLGLAMVPIVWVGTCVGAAEELACADSSGSITAWMQHATSQLRDVEEADGQDTSCCRNQKKH